MVKFFEGSIFDVSNAHRYTANEVYLDVNGKHNAVRLDSYNPGDAVVSRKFTQLAEQPRGAITALKEMVDKCRRPSENAHRRPIGNRGTFSIWP